MTDDVQPEEGQGGSPFDSYLQTIPESWDGLNATYAGPRAVAEQYLRGSERHLNSKFEEHADYRKQWEPYERIENLPPAEQLQEVMGFLNNPEAVKQWAIEQAQAEGYTKAEAQELGEEAELREEGFSEAQIQQLLDQRVAQEVQPVREELAELRFTQGEQLETQHIREELARLEAEHKLNLDEDQRAVLLDLGLPYAKINAEEELPPGDVSWVVKGLERFKEVGTQANRTFIEEASAQPAAAITAGGMAKTKPITNFEDANTAARERWRAQFRDQSQT